MMPENRKQAFAYFGLAGIAGLFVASCLLSAAIPAIRQHPEIFRKMRAWRLGARFITVKGVVLQAHGNDCGPASLKMILADHGVEYSLPDLTAKLRLNVHGTSLRQLRLAAERLGVPAKSWLVRPEDLPQVPLPAIAFVSRNHFVVIRRFIAFNVLEVDDPALGKLQWPVRSFQRIWSGETLVFDPAWVPL